MSRKRTLNFGYRRGAMQLEPIFQGEDRLYQDDPIEPKRRYVATDPRRRMDDVSCFSCGVYMGRGHNHRATCALCHTLYAARAAKMAKEMEDEGWAIRAMVEAVQAIHRYATDKHAQERAQRTVDAWLTGEE